MLPVPRLPAQSSQRSRGSGQVRTPRTPSPAVLRGETISVAPHLPRVNPGAPNRVCGALSHHLPTPSLMQQTVPAALLPFSSSPGTGDPCLCLEASFLADWESSSPLSLVQQRTKSMLTGTDRPQPDPEEAGYRAGLGRKGVAAWASPWQGVPGPPGHGCGHCAVQTREPRATPGTGLPACSVSFLKQALLD